MKQADLIPGQVYTLKMTGEFCTVSGHHISDPQTVFGEDEKGKVKGIFVGCVDITANLGIEDKTVRNIFYLVGGRGIAYLMYGAENLDYIVGPYHPIWSDEVQSVPFPEGNIATIDLNKYNQEVHEDGRVEFIPKPKVHIKVFISTTNQFRANVEMEGGPGFEIGVGGNGWDLGMGKPYQKEILLKCRELVNDLNRKLVDFEMQAL